ncbi:MAG: sigma-70 family RNA polymerase sigma factor [Tannerellaceae bacterium]|jgi:RNA polymerase sigma-70 factor (ECF subfamily)|nr:sigma-70 family RNA polymerase sigma factor [Tannerellaceae bacterium]
MKDDRKTINLFNDKEQQRLVIQLKKGSYEAFDVLYKTYFDLLYGYVFRLTRSHSSTRETVQNTFVKIWQNRELLDANQSFKAYLFKIAQNDIIDGLRNLVNNPVFEDYISYCEQEKMIIHAEQEFDIEMFHFLLNKAKRKLSPRQAEVFELIKEEGFTSREAAQKLSLPEQVIYNYLSQALSILRKELKQIAPLFTFFLICF